MVIWDGRSGCLDPAQFVNLCVDRRICHRKWQFLFEVAILPNGWSDLFGKPEDTELKFPQYLNILQPQLIWLGENSARWKHNQTTWLVGAKPAPRLWNLQLLHFTTMGQATTKTTTALRCFDPNLWTVTRAIHTAKLCVHSDLRLTVSLILNLVFECIWCIELRILTGLHVVTLHYRASTEPANKDLLSEHPLILAKVVGSQAWDNVGEANEEVGVSQNRACRSENFNTQTDQKFEDVARHWCLEFPDKIAFEELDGTPWPGVLTLTHRQPEGDLPNG